jgi:hypothetical protein
MRQQSEVNRFVMNYLKHGPEPVESVYSAAFQWSRVPRGMVDGALMHYRVQRLKNADNGVKYVALPDNLVAIWWADRKPAHCFTGAAHGGSAA